MELPYFANPRCGHLDEDVAKVGHASASCADLEFTTGPQAATIF
jgi:hypothetical protein